MKPPRLIYSTTAISAYDYHICMALDDVRLRIRDLAKSRSAKDGTIGAVMALRVLLAGELGKASSAVAKGEVEFWQEEYTRWVERVRKRFPKDVTAADVLATAKQEFAALREMGIDLPSIIWQSDAVKGMRLEEQRRQESNPEADEST